MLLRFASDCLDRQDADQRTPGSGSLGCPIRCPGSTRSAKARSAKCHARRSNL